MGKTFIEILGDSAKKQKEIISGVKDSAVENAVNWVESTQQNLTSRISNVTSLVDTALKSSTQMVKDIARYNVVTKSIENVYDSQVQANKYGMNKAVLDTFCDSSIAGVKHTFNQVAGVAQLIGSDTSIKNLKKEAANTVRDYIEEQKEIMKCYVNTSKTLEADLIQATEEYDQALQNNTNSMLQSVSQGVNGLLTAQLNYFQNKAENASEALKTNTEYYTGNLKAFSDYISHMYQNNKESKAELREWGSEKTSKGIGKLIASKYYTFPSPINDFGDNVLAAVYSLERLKRIDQEHTNIFNWDFVDDFETAILSDAAVLMSRGLFGIWNPTDLMLTSVEKQADYFDELKKHDYDIRYAEIPYDGDTVIDLISAGIKGLPFGDMFEASFLEYIVGREVDEQKAVTSALVESGVYVGNELLGYLAKLIGQEIPLPTKTIETIIARGIMSDDNYLINKDVSGDLAAELVMRMWDDRNNFYGHGSLFFPENEIDYSKNYNDNPQTGHSELIAPVINISIAEVNEASDVKALTAQITNALAQAIQNSTRLGA